MTTNKAKVALKAVPINKTRNMTIKLHKGQTEENALTKTALDATTTNAATTVDYLVGMVPGINLQDCIDELAADAKLVNSGNLGKLEGMLTAQANALNAMFNTLAQRAIRADMMPKLDTYMRLALKAQSQCRSTVEAIAEMKFPKSATFIKQANIANQQQVNNNPTSACEKNITPTNELLEVHHGERLDTRTQSQAIRADSQLETVGEIQRPALQRRKNPQ